MQIIVSYISLKHRERERELVSVCGPEVNQLKLRQLADTILGNYIKYPFQDKLRERKSMKGMRGQLEGEDRNREREKQEV